MPFSSPRNAAISYLVLRDLSDGDIIEWPLPPDHPLKALFDGLESGGFIARWDRIWPLSDRYRLTEKGIAALEALYRPAGAEAFFESLRARNIPAVERRAELERAQLHPVIWPILHDPHTHWSTVDQDQGRYYRFFWEDQSPLRRNPAPPNRPAVAYPAGAPARAAAYPHHPSPVHGTLFDLDREARDPSMYYYSGNQDRDLS